MSEDWDSLRLAVERHRTEPESNPRLGDWSPEFERISMRFRTAMPACEWEVIFSGCMTG